MSECVSGYWFLPSEPYVTLGGVVVDGDITPALFELLWERGEPSTFGQGGERRWDPAVRHSRTLTDAMFTWPFMHLVTTMVTNELWSGLHREALQQGRPSLVETADRFELRFDCCLLYSSEGRFEEHVDRPRSPSMTHTVVVNLPVSDAEQSYLFRCQGHDALRTDSRPNWVMFPSQAAHGLVMHHGYRVSLVFHVFDAEEVLVRTSAGDTLLED